MSHRQMCSRLALTILVACAMPIGPAPTMADDAKTVRQPSRYFGIRIVDEETGRGVPLVRLRTTGSVDWWSDSNGWIAFSEPGLMDQQVHFAIESPGYEIEADGFGFRGVRLHTAAGETAVVKVKRTQLAERLYRVTGQGIYRDSELLGQDVPPGIELLSGGVIGQDSVQMVPYRGRYFWLWGDTTLPHYPLGNFHVTAALSPAAGPEGFDPDQGIPLEYFIDDQTGRVRKMLPVDQPGAVWLWGLTSLPDDEWNEKLVAHYSRHLRLGEMVEHGIATWDENQQRFVKQVTFELSNTWQIPRGHAVRHRDDDGDWVYFAEPFATTRVAARVDALLDPDQYQALAWNADQRQYEWQSTHGPTTAADEATLIAAGEIDRGQARYQIEDVESGELVEMHRGSINWNAYRGRWILVACEINRSGDPSHLGEIWYAEAESITGPWRKAIKIATHPNYSFYNPRHHAVMDAADGRVIYFEGTYTQMFSGSTCATPRYDYNQILYRLDLSRLRTRLR